MNTNFDILYELDDNLVLDINSFNNIFREKLKTDISVTLDNDNITNFTSVINFDNTVYENMVGRVFIVNPSIDLVGGILHLDNNRIRYPRGKTYLVYIPIGINYNFTNIEKGYLNIISSSVIATKLPNNEITNVLTFSVEINPFTRIVKSTGKRLYTDDELELMFSMTPDNKHDEVKTQLLLDIISVDKLQDNPNMYFKSHYKIYDSLLKLLDNVDKPCDLGDVDGKRIMDPNSRVCYKSNTKWTTSGICKNFNELFKSKLKTDIDVVFSEDEILKYTVNSHFVKHVDRIRDEKMIGTLLLVYPSSDLLGGVLSVSNVDVEHSPGEHHLVYIPIGMEHSVSTIKQGCRYVFKTCIYAENLPANVVLNISNTHVNINPFTRIVSETGRRLPTDQELDQICSGTCKERRHFTRSNIIGKALSSKFVSLCD